MRMIFIALCLVVGSIMPATSINETQAAYLSVFDDGYLMGSLHMDAANTNNMTVIELFNRNVAKFNEWANATFSPGEAKRICLAFIPLRG